ncbi:hypothetical protein THAOC_24206, partial [Thalassiosira oceanica]
PPGVLRARHRGVLHGGAHVRSLAGSRDDAGGGGAPVPDAVRPGEERDVRERVQQPRPRRRGGISAAEDEPPGGGQARHSGDH